MNAEERAFTTAEEITHLLNIYGIRVPEDIEAEIGELIQKKYAEIEESAWMYEDLKY